MELVSSNTLIIVLLFFILILILTKEFTQFDNSLKYIGMFLLDLFENTFGVLGYTTGTVVNKTADYSADVAHVGVDITKGTFQDIGELLQRGSVELKNRHNVIGGGGGGTDTNTTTQQTPPPPQTAQQTYSPEKTKEPEPDSASNSIQKPIVSNKAGWCLVGSFHGKNSCIQTNEGDTCVSGKVFDKEIGCVQHR